MKQIVFLSLVLIAAPLVVGAQSGTNPPAAARAGQDKAGPMTREELITLVRQRGPQRVTEGDIADMVAAQGLAFKLDDRFLQELRAAGAQEFLIESLKHSEEQAALPRLKDATTDLGSGAPDPGTLSPEELKRERDAEIAKLPFLEQAQVHALDFSAELPNFVVNQNVSRFVRTPNTRGNWVADDKLVIEETYQIDKGEQLKLLSVNGKPATKTYDQLDGATSTGEFSAVLGGIFVPDSHTQFPEVKHVQFR
ncbi:MAG TPA: hypothetical protein VEZ90_01700, partial [Blastocatellia bacterium]|nr:hypothetical protein [Blastocatellia bacterium]